MMRWAGTAHDPLLVAVYDYEARPKVACRRTQARLSTTSRPVRHAEFPEALPLTPPLRREAERARRSSGT